MDLVEREKWNNDNRCTSPEKLGLIKNTEMNEKIGDIENASIKKENVIRDTDEVIETNSKILHFGAIVLSNDSEFVVRNQENGK